MSPERKSLLLFELRVMNSLALRDVRNSYKRTRLGPWWGAITATVMVLALWSVFGVLFAEEGYFSFLASGILLWGLVSGVLAAASSIFISNDSFIKALPLPAWVFIGRTIEKSLLIFLHSLPLVPISVLLTGGKIGFEALWFIPGLALVLLNLTWLSGTIALAATRFRDLSPVVASIVLVLFYLTPIFWKPDILHPTARESFLEWNPFYRLINLLRQPWLGSIPTLDDWGIGLLFALVGWAQFLVLYKKFSPRVPFWL